MMHRWLASETVAGASSKSNSYHGEPYIPADVFSVSCHLCRLQGRVLCDHHVTLGQDTLLTGLINIVDANI